MKECAWCKVKSPLLDVWPYLVKVKPLTHRWLHPGECAEKWHEQYRAWLKGEA